MAGSNPGNANLPIGVRKTAMQQKDGPKSKCQPANQEIGVPRKPIENVSRWHSRGYLPHFDGSDVTQHVTFHLADSLPQDALSRIESEVRLIPAEKQDAERRKRLDAWIDAGHGSCVLRHPEIAGMVQESLLMFDAQRYRLLAWVVMPNHVHVLFQPMNESAVAKIVASWKKFTARKIRDALREDANPEIGAPRSTQTANREIGVPRKSVPRNGAPVTSSDASVWHREYWDRYIRDKNHLDRTILYIHQNPVKAGLAATPASWQWSSAFPGNANLPIGAGSEKP